ncbi:MAG: hypothetical protein Kow0037_07440 [Calditrichia bacterium]
MRKIIGAGAVLALMLFLMGCGKSGEAVYKEMETAYTEMNNQITAKRAEVNSRDSFNAWKDYAAKMREEYLVKFEHYQDVPEADFWRAKVFIDLEKYDEATALLDKVLTKEVNFKVQAKFEKVKVLQVKGDWPTALNLFREIENTVEKNGEYYELVAGFAWELEDAALRKEFTEKFLQASELPQRLQSYVSYMYENLSAIAREQGNLEEAKRILKEAIAKLKAENKDVESLEFTLKKTELIGKPASALLAKTWLNSRPVNLKKLKGKVVLVDFWATWCGPCRAVIPHLVEMYQQHKKDGLEIIGFTRLYGTYRDDIQNLGKVSPEKEIELTREFLKRHKIEYPIAIAENTTIFDKYAVRGIPTLFIIDKTGKIVDFKVGSGNEALLKKQVFSLL